MEANLHVPNFSLLVLVLGQLCADVTSLASRPLTRRIGAGVSGMKQAADLLRESARATSALSYHGLGMGVGLPRAVRVLAGQHHQPAFPPLIATRKMSDIASGGRPRSSAVAERGSSSNSTTT